MSTMVIQYQSLVSCAQCSVLAHAQTCSRESHIFCRTYRQELVLYHTSPSSLMERQLRIVRISPTIGLMETIYLTHHATMLGSAKTSNVSKQINYTTPCMQNRSSTD